MGYSERYGNIIKEKIKPQHAAAFFGALITGIICHMPAMVKFLPVYDSFWNIYSPQDMISSGRPFLTYACGITSYYNLPWINGIVGVFYIALAAVLIAGLYEIKNMFAAVALGGILAAFPAVTGTFAFGYTLDGYMLAFLLSTLAVYLTHKYKWGFIPGIFAMGFATGIYQSYFFTGALLAITVCMLALSEGKEWKKVLSSAWRYAAMGLGGYVFYLIALKIMLAVKHVTLSGYQGTDKVLGLSFSTIIPGLKAAFTDFREFTFAGGIFTENIFMKIAYTAFLSVALLGFGWQIYRNKVYKKPVNLFLIVLCAVLVPFTASGVKIMSQDSLFHILMRMPWAVLFATGIALFDRLTLSGELKKQKEEGMEVMLVLFKVMGFVMAFCMIFHFILAANVVYFNLNERYEKTYALALRIADRLEQTEGYRQGDEVAILGGFPNTLNYPTTDITGKVTGGYHETSGDIAVESSEKYAEFMKHFLNVTIEVPDFEKQIEIGGTEEFLEMPCFPEKGSIRQIDGVWIIKING